MTQAFKKPTCPQCGSAAKVRFRSTLKTFICDRCGVTWKKETAKESPKE